MIEAEDIDFIDGLYSLEAHHEERKKATQLVELQRVAVGLPAKMRWSNRLAVPHALKKIRASETPAEREQRRKIRKREREQSRRYASGIALLDQ